jgi:beta-N-acetylhexosaminidase
MWIEHVYDRRAVLRGARIVAVGPHAAEVTEDAMRWWSSTRLALAAAALVAMVITGTVVARAFGSKEGHQRTGTPVQPAAPTSATALPRSAPPASTPASPDRAQRVEACVTSTMAGLSAQGRVGQVLMIGTQVTNPPGLADTVRQYQLGGAFLAGRASPSAATLRQGILALQKAAGPIPLQIAVDQEGGQVQTLKGADFPVIPSAVQQGQWDDATLRGRTTDWAGRLAQAGVTLDLAPVADTVPAGTADANPPIGAFSRQYGSAPDQVADKIHTVVAAAQEAGLLTTLKHFPGLGRVRANTDTSTQAVDNTATADDPYLNPFASGIQAGSAAVMISSARYPKLDANAVAAFSAPIVTGLLRQRLGYTGLIVSDDLGAAAAVGSVPVGERAVRFIQAGGDLVLSVKASDAGPMSAALLAAAQASPAFDARITEAARQVIRSKYRAGLLTCR